jgi:hypothetical protein
MLMHLHGFLEGGEAVNVAAESVAAEEQSRLSGEAQLSSTAAGRSLFPFISWL